MSSALGQMNRTCRAGGVASRPRAFTAAKRSARPHQIARVATMERGIEAETPLTSRPESLLRPGIDSENSLKAKFERIILDAQESICKAVEEVDGTKFREDCWARPAGGGGISKVLQGGNVWEKAGVNVSVVYGTMPPEAYRAATGNDSVTKNGSSGRVPFFAAGISSVMHPYNPHCPTMHFNYRFFETEEWNGIPGQWWFGGGTDITPSYIDEEDMKHFHGTYKQVCDRHDPEYYAKFKKWCDEYFHIKHRGETRGLGGIFYDDHNDRDPDTIMAFSKDCVNNVAEAYIPIIKKHMNDPFTEQEKEWQQMRRGRYVEFNLVYDRGTTFGLKTGGRIESILMSLPLTARWQYDYTPEKGTREWELIDACRHPRDWVSL